MIPRIGDIIVILDFVAGQEYFLVADLTMNIMSVIQVRDGMFSKLVIVPKSKDEIDYAKPYSNSFRKREK